MSAGAEATEERATSEQPATERLYRTVTPPYFGRPDTEMDVLGWGFFLGILVLLVPLLPFMVILWVGGKLLGALRRRR